MNDWIQAWRRAVVREQRGVARGTQLTTVELPDDLPFPFEPGHVIALRAETPAGLVRHPYTLCGAEPASRQALLVYRVIPGGRLTPTLASLPSGTEVEISGLHHAPIQEELDPAATSILGLSTGSGLGPLWGYATQALAKGESRPIHLVVGVREEADLPLREELEALAARHLNFRWSPVISRPADSWTGLRGRLTDHAPAFLPEPSGTHVHLVGNMAMVRTMETALLAAGLPPGRVTKEGFFNWNAEADEAVAMDIARSLRSRLAS